MSDRVPEDFQVSFTEMKHGTRDDYLALHQLEQPFLNHTGERVLKELARQADETLAGYKINRLEHGLQSATRALNDGAERGCRRAGDAQGRPLPGLPTVASAFGI